MTIQEMQQRKIELGYTNEMLAEKSGVPLGTVQKIFAGQTKAPRIRTILALEQVLKPQDLPGVPRRPHAPGGPVQYRYEFEKEQQSVVAEPQAAYNASTVSGEKTREAAREALKKGIISEELQGTYTIDDYYLLPDERRIELIDGVFYDMTGPLKVHQQILVHLGYLLYSCVGKHPECELYIAPSDVRLDNDEMTMVQPDLFVVCDSEDDDPRRTNGAPDFAVEILSPSSRSHDMIRKLYKYRYAGVREYWIVDPENQQVIVYEFEKSDLPAIFTFSDTVPVGISGGECSVDFSVIREKVKKYLPER